VDLLRGRVVWFGGKRAQDRAALAGGPKPAMLQYGRMLRLRVVTHGRTIAGMRTRIVFISLALGLLVALAAGCGGDPAASDGSNEHVVAAFYPLAYAAQTIGGPTTDVTNMTPAGAEPHDLEVSPGDVQEIHSADLVLLLGHGFQPQLERAAGNGDKVVRLLDTRGLHRFADGDPHVWLDPLRYALIAKRIGAALHRERPAARLAARLGSLDRDYQRGLAHCARKEIVTSHEAFAYLAQRYGLRQIAITGLTPEAEPAPRDLQRVIDLVRSTHATTVFFETLVSPRIAETVAREADARTAVLNPIEGLTEAEAKQGVDYFSLMRTNLSTLRRALGCH
jgi:zinc transport system substrate-binding protein